MADLHSIAENSKATLSSAIADLRSKVRTMSSHVDEAEKTTQRHNRDLRRLQAPTSAYTTTLLNITRKIEDLDNRGHRHNLWVCGLPEFLSPPTWKPQ